MALAAGTAHDESAPTAQEGTMSDQHPEGEDLGDQFAQAAKPRGTMSTRQDDAEGGSMKETFEENVQELGRGENPLAQGEEGASGQDTTDDEDPDGHADAFSPGRSDLPD